MKPHKYSVASERMPTKFRGTQSNRVYDAKRKNPEYDPTNTRLNPVETFGACVNSIKKVRRGSRKYVSYCNSYHAVLGNGYCMKCWDSMGQDTDLDDAKHLLETTE